MAKKRALGRGLSALIPEDSKNDIREQLLNNKKIQEQVVTLNVSELIANDNQPRKEFEQQALLSLSDSIKLHGVLQPIIVRPFNKHYEIVAGERRFRAAKLAELKEVPCIIRSISNKLSAQLALVENIQRENLNQIEEAKAFEQLMSEYSLTQLELSKAVGKSRAYITNTTRLLKLDTRVIELIRTQEITAGHGRSLLMLDDKNEQFTIAEIIIRKNLSVREIEEMVKKLKKQRSQGLEEKILVKNIDPHIKQFEDELMSYFGTKVRLKDKKGKGKIEIDYYTLDDLDRILELLDKN